MLVVSLLVGGIQTHNLSLLPLLLSLFNHQANFITLVVIIRLTRDAFVRSNLMAVKLEISLSEVENWSIYQKLKEDL